MNRSLLLLQLYMLVVVSLCACSHPEIKESLVHVDSIMEEYPDSALKIIRVLDKHLLDSEELKAKYSLLLTQALVKNDYILNSDTILRDAILFYEKDRSFNGMRTAFYQSVIYYNSKAFSRAMLSAMKAYEISVDRKDDYWIAKSAEKIADIFNATYNSEESVKFNYEAVHHYNKANKIPNHRYALCDLGIAYNNIGNPQASISILDSIINLSEQVPVDSALASYAYAALIPARIKAKDYDLAEKDFYKFTQLKNYYYPYPDVLACLAQVELHKGNIESAEKILCGIDSVQENPMNAAALMGSMIDLYLFKKDYKNAQKYTEKVLTLQSKEMRKTIRHSVTAAQRDYYNSKIVEETTQYNRRVGTLKLLWGLLLIIVVISGIIIYYKIKIKNVEKEKYVSDLNNMSLRVKRMSNEIEAMAKDLDRKDSTLDSFQKDLDKHKHAAIEIKDNFELVWNENQTMRAEIESLFKNQWDTINVLCNTFFDLPESAKSKSKSNILLKIESELNKIKSPRSIKIIELSVNKYMDNIINKLKNQCPFLSPSDITFITLIYAGFEPRAVCLFTDIKLKYYYNKKKRLAIRINNYEATDKEIFVSRLR